MSRHSSQPQPLRPCTCAPRWVPPGRENTIQTHLLNVRPHHPVRSVASRPVQLLGALAALKHTPEKLWMERLLHRVSQRLPFYTTAERLLLLQHIGSLRFLPSRGWIMAFLSASHPHISSYSPPAVATTLSVFALWKLAPPPRYLWTLLQLFRVQAEKASLGDIATVSQGRRWVTHALVRLAGVGNPGHLETPMCAPTPHRPAHVLCLFQGSRETGWERRWQRSHNFRISAAAQSTTPENHERASL